MTDMSGNEMSEAIPPVYAEFIAAMGEHGILLQPEIRDDFQRRAGFQRALKCA